MKSLHTFSTNPARTRKLIDEETNRDNYIQGGPKMAPFLYALTLPILILTDFQNYFTVRIRRKLVKILSLKIPTHLKCVATLPCEISVS